MLPRSRTSRPYSAAVVGLRTVCNRFTVRNVSEPEHAAAGARCTPSAGNDGEFGTVLPLGGADGRKMHSMRVHVVVCILTYSRCGMHHQRPAAAVQVRQHQRARQLRAVFE